MSSTLTVLRIVVAVGDEVIVKVREIDDQGRLNLSRRDALIEVEGLVPENDLSDEPRRAPRRDNRGGRDGGEEITAAAEAATAERDINP